MTYPSMMVHVDFDPATEARVHMAAGLADRFEATLIGVAACAPHPPLAWGGFGLAPLFTEENVADLKVALDQLEWRFRSIAVTGSRQVGWRSALDRPTEFVAREASAVDLVIIGRERLSADLFRSLDPGALLLQVGRPVLLVPAGINRLDANRVLVAWKDTREARRALSDSLPFLHDAEKVFLVEVCAEHEGEAVQHHVNNVMSYLAHHRITATALTLQAANVTDELLGFVRKEKVELLVAGAYVHSRLSELVFGGVTHDLLYKSPICCLFSH